MHILHYFMLFATCIYATNSQRIITFGSGHDACSQSNPYCESRRACAGVPGGPPKSAMPVLNYTLSPGMYDHGDYSDQRNNGGRYETRSYDYVDKKNWPAGKSVRNWSIVEQTPKLPSQQVQLLGSWIIFGGWDQVICSLRVTTSCAWRCGMLLSFSGRQAAYTLRTSWTWCIQ